MTIGDQTRGPRALADCNLDASGLGAQLERYPDSAGKRPLSSGYPAG